ncbi:MAG: hypothetical protein PVH17_04585, partial [Anaerolineae bacterium]
TVAVRCKRMNLEVSEELAAEGYRFYAREASEFAEASAKAVAEALECAYAGIEMDSMFQAEKGP